MLVSRTRIVTWFVCSSPHSQQRASPINYSSFISTLTPHLLSLVLHPRSHSAYRVCLSEEPLGASSNGWICQHGCHCCPSGIVFLGTVFPFHSIPGNGHDVGSCREIQPRNGPSRRPALEYTVQLVLSIIRSADCAKLAMHEFAEREEGIAPGQFRVWLGCMHK